MRTDTPIPASITTLPRNRKRLVPRALLGLAMLTMAALGTRAVARESSRYALAADAKKIEEVLSQTPAANYRIHAVRVGLSKHARRGLFIADPALPRRIEVAFSFFVISGGERVILVDTGFVNRRMIDRWRVEDYRDPVAALGRVGFEPGQVTDVIVTHGHWDHIGGLSRFGHARIWIGKGAFGSLQRSGGDWLTRLLRTARAEDRLHVVETIGSIAPSVVVVPAGLHAPGFQYVVARSGDEVFVLASDVAPLWANFERRKVTGQTSDPRRTLAVQDAMLELVGHDISRIIPGHEPRIYDGAGADGVVLVNDGDRAAPDAGSPADSGSCDRLPRASAPRLLAHPGSKTPIPACPRE